MLRGLFEGRAESPERKGGDVVKAKILNPKEILLDIQGITLLSKEEYRAAKDIIPRINDWWWLRSPGNYSDFAAYVGNDGSVFNRGRHVCNDCGGVRPALIVNQESANLCLNDKVLLWGYTWTVVGNNLMLCDELIYNRRFDEIENRFETSEIRRYLEEWLSKNMHSEAVREG